MENVLDIQSCIKNQNQNCSHEVKHWGITILLNRSKTYKTVKIRISYSINVIKSLKLHTYIRDALVIFLSNA